MVWRHRRMLELFTEKPNLYRTRQPETDAAMIRQTTRPLREAQGGANERSDASGGCPQAGNPQTQQPTRKS